MQVLWQGENYLLKKKSSRHKNRPSQMGITLSAKELDYLFVEKKPYRTCKENITKTHSGGHFKSDSCHLQTRPS